MKPKIIIPIFTFFLALLHFQAEAKLVLACSSQVTPINGVESILINPNALAIFNDCRKSGETISYSEPYLSEGKECISGSIYTVKVTISNNCGEEASCELLFMLKPQFIEIYSCFQYTVPLGCDDPIFYSEEDLDLNACDIVSDIVIKLTGPLPLNNCNEKYIITYYVYDIFGNKESCSRIVNKYCPCPDMYCTQTMQQYGGTSFSVCSGNTQIQKIQDITGGNGLSIGVPALNKSFNFNSSDAVCLNSALPAAHPSAILGPGNHSFGNNCSTPNIAQSPLGKIDNELAGALIALKLNVNFASPNFTGKLFKDLVFEQSCYQTLAAANCSAIIPIPNSEINYCLDVAFYDAINDYLGSSPTLQDIIDYADFAIAGGTVGVGLDKILNSILAINHSFQYCRFLKNNSWYTPANFENENIESRSINNAIFHLYPNPTIGELQIKLEREIDEEITLNILDLRGHSVGQYYVSESDMSSSFSIDLSQLPSGLYIVQLISGSDQTFKKVLLQK